MDAHYKVISESADGFTQVRLTISIFRDKPYLSIREWYLDFDESWQPSKNGFTWLLTDEILQRIFISFKDILANIDLEELNSCLE